MTGCRAPWGAFFDPRAGIFFRLFAHTVGEVIEMSYVNPAIRDKFESMPIDLKNAILNMDVRLESMSDLMACLERIVAEGERHA